MNIIVIDDSIERHEQIKMLLTEENVVSAINALDGIEMLQSQEWDMVFLDHDLGGKIDGDVVARNMVTHSLSLDAQVIVQSVNPVGAKRIEDILAKTHKVMRIAFPQMIEALRKG